MNRIAIIAVTLTWATTARAHDWYPASCCNALQVYADGSHTGDCAPIPPEAVQEVSGGYVVTLRPGDHPLATREISRTFNDVGASAYPSAMWSQDGQPHACVLPSIQHVQCLFVPPPGS